MLNRLKALSLLAPDAVILTPVADSDVIVAHKNGTDNTANRTLCKIAPAQAGEPTGPITLTCKNSMAPRPRAAPGRGRIFLQVKSDKQQAGSGEYQAGDSTD